MKRNLIRLLLWLVGIPIVFGVGWAAILLRLPEIYMQFAGGLAFGVWLGIISQDLWQLDREAITRWMQNNLRALPSMIVFISVMAVWIMLAPKEVKQSFLSFFLDKASWSQAMAFVLGMFIGKGFVIVVRSYRKRLIEAQI